VSSVALRLSCGTTLLMYLLDSWLL